MMLRGQILLVALLSAAPGHPALPPQPVQPSAQPELAPSPYLPELAPDPFVRLEMRPAAARRRPHGPRQRPESQRAGLLAPSPYDLDLVPNPYPGSSPARSVLTAATASLAVGGNLEPRVLAPSPYEPQLPSDLAPSPY